MDDPWIKELMCLKNMISEVKTKVEYLENSIEEIKELMKDQDKKTSKCINGIKSEIDKMDDRIYDLEKFKWSVIGASVALSTLVSILIQYIISHIK